MRVIHDPEDAAETVLASTVTAADSLLSKAIGLRFRRSLPPEQAMVFRFGRVGRRDIDMLFVPFPIDVLWLVDGTVERSTRLRPWIGFGVARADTVVELPAGAADEVRTGDTVRIVDEPAQGDSGV